MRKNFPMLVACDIGDKTQKYVVFGSVWSGLSNGDFYNTLKSVTDLRVNEKCWGTFQWKKSKDAEYTGKYKKFIDIFFDQNINFSCLVVDKDLLSSSGSHMGANITEAIPNLSVMHISRCAMRYCPNGSEVTVLLDRGEHTRSILKVKEELNNYTTRNLPDTEVRIKDVQEINCRKLSTLQMCDLLTAAVSKAFNGTRTSVANKEIFDHIELKLGKSLSSPTVPYDTKFNIWAWRPGALFR